MKIKAAPVHKPTIEGEDPFCSRIVRGFMSGTECIIYANIIVKVNKVLKG
jgi:hypothetical protein